MKNIPELAFNLDVPEAVLQRAKAIKLLILDVDGVLTNGEIYITAQGEEIKAFNTLDGHGLKMLQKTGVQLAIITGRDAAGVGHRVRGLGIDHYLAGIHDKRTAYLNLIAQLGLSQEQCAYVGDDVVDLPVMVRCGLPIAVPSAHNWVIHYADYVTQAAAGLGAVREACEMIMWAQGSLQDALTEYVL
ncbi:MULTISPECIES: KdsC family phosphatase [Vitreoscilla]|uniref:HAD family hydrolase n=1 Tax=Vitreoscilla stercoraria TaxID=61 RepID=A0ABY4ECN9_VITST|nr:MULTISPECIES: HAD family hydrolase [Vitreoscilla]AUZ05496.2 3-deoxy-D-manno-octulosonate 8-phosphate phosphatase YrbI [Vitreoscilla sp. C1]UOO93212.1 HAD family hydrolase [Vitreoscilla stercoraria]